MMYKWRLHDTETCDCDYESQTINHITIKCPICAFKGTMEDIHLVKDKAAEWMRNPDLEL